MKNRMQTALKTGLTFGTLLVGLGGLAVVGADPKGGTITPTSGAGEPKDATSPVSAKPWDFKSRSPIATKIEKALQDPTEVNFTDMPLKDALAFLAEHHQVEILTDANALSDEGISIDQTVTLVMSGVSLKSTLRLMLSPLLLEYVIKNDALIVTTEAVANDTYEVRVYNNTRLPNLAPKELVDIITTVVEPGNWTIKKVTETPATKVYAPAAPVPADSKAPNPVEGGGSDGSSLGCICAVANTLVVRQTRRIHEEIIELLDQLERQQAAVQSRPAKSS